jgi:hypothetical protein
VEEGIQPKLMNYELVKSIRLPSDRMGTAQNFYYSERRGAYNAVWRERHKGLKLGRGQAVSTASRLKVSVED